MRERGYLYIAVIRRRVASICRFANENVIASFFTGIRHAFLSDRWLEISTDFFVSGLVVCVGGNGRFVCIFCFWTTRRIVRSLSFFRVNFLVHIPVSPASRVMWVGCCHAQYHNVWLLPRTQLCPSSVNTRS